MTPRQIETELYNANFWSQVYKEYTNAREFSYLICVRSNSFKSIWKIEYGRLLIKKLAHQFLNHRKRKYWLNLFSNTSNYEVSDNPNDQSLLFLCENKKFKDMVKIRCEFIKWCIKHFLKYKH